MTDKAKSVNISLYQSQIEKIKLFKKQNEKLFKSEASVFQYIINSFFETDKKTMRHNAIIYLLYPIALEIIVLYGAISIGNANEVLYEQGMYFHDLYLLGRIFSIISFGIMSILIASIYILYKKKNEK